MELIIRMVEKVFENDHFPRECFLRPVRIRLFTEPLEKYFQDAGLSFPRTIRIPIGAARNAKMNLFAE